MRSKNNAVYYKTVYCRNCGTEIENAYANTKYCKECAKVIHNKSTVESRRKTQLATEIKENKRIDTTAEICRIANAARKAGMSYGEYVSKKGLK